MLMMNRHFFVIMFSLFFIGVIFWWQKPIAAVSAMAGGNSQDDPYQIVKNYWTKMDYRQFDLTGKMVAYSALSEHNQLIKELKNNPLLSIQKVEVENTPANNTFLAKVTTGSVIDSKKQVNYTMIVNKSGQGYLITSIKVVP